MSSVAYENKETGQRYRLGGPDSMNPFEILIRTVGTLSNLVIFDTEFRDLNPDNATYFMANTDFRNCRFINCDFSGCSTHNCTFADDYLPRKRVSGGKNRCH